ncbi:MAG: WD40/YVTN/BNR-like repeat-containing protein [Polaribacter sp.]
MYKIFTFVLAVILLFSCTQEYTPRNFQTISLQSISMDSTSIRAIVAVDSSKVYFVGSDGSHGFQWTGEKPAPISFIRYEDSIIPHFRSIATNGSDYFALSIGNPALLYKLDYETSNLVYKEENEKVFYDSMKFFDEKHGIAMGDPTEDCLSIILTEDGGQTWEKLPCESLPKVVEGEAAFAASNTNIKVLGATAWIVTGGKQARVFKSDDYGKTWKVYETPIIHGNGPQGIYSVDFADENNGFVIGGNYSKADENIANKAITTDGGKTWSLVANGKEPNYKSCVQYVPNTSGKELFAVDKTGISFSNDGGYTWKKVSNEGFYVIQFVDENTAWLAGNQKIAKLKLN